MEQRPNENDFKDRDPKKTDRDRKLAEKIGPVRKNAGNKDQPQEDNRSGNKKTDSKSEEN